MNPLLPWYRWSGKQLILNIRVVPRSKQDGIAGIHGDCLRIRIAAPPADGQANTRLIEFLAGEFGVPKRSVSLLAGDSSQRKRIAITGPTRFPPGIEAASRGLPGTGT